MQIIIPFAHALADFWYNMSFYGDLIFTLARTLFVVTITHLVTWSRKNELKAVEVTKEQDSERRLEDESALGAEDGLEEQPRRSMCAERRRRIARLVAAVQWQQRGRRFRPRRDYGASPPDL